MTTVIEFEHFSAEGSVPCNLIIYNLIKSRFSLECEANLPTGSKVSLLWGGDEVLLVSCANEKSLMIATKILATLSRKWGGIPENRATMSYSDEFRQFMHVSGITPETVEFYVKLLVTGKLTGKTCKRPDEAVIASGLKALPEWRICSFYEQAIREVPCIRTLVPVPGFILSRFIY